MSRFHLPIRVIFYREKGDVIAHCLELDVVGHGDTHKEALEMLEGAIAVQVEEFLETKNLENFLTPADPKYVAMFAEGKSVEGKVEIHIDSVECYPSEVREYDEEACGV